MSREIIEARFAHDEIVRKYTRIASIYDLFGILVELKALTGSGCSCRFKIAVIRLSTGFHKKCLKQGQFINFLNKFKRDQLEEGHN